MVSERDLRNHLAGAGDDSDPAAARGSDLAERDYALGEALNVLKGLALRNARPVAGEPPAKR
jgi:hypothetical protein